MQHLAELISFYASISPKLMKSMDVQAFVWLRPFVLISLIVVKIYNCVYVYI